jgi:molybdenum cofactor synthesis domain-containing protein
MATASILIVGDEILSGEVLDQNAPEMIRVFADHGVPVHRVVTVPDHAEAIVEEIRHLRAVSEVVVVSGGIGPTHDDLTRPAVAKALGLALQRLPEAEERIRQWYGGRETEAELAMALMPEGARLLPGERTGTFGFEARGVYVLPGVPELFRDIATALPGRLAGRPLHRCEIVSRRREGEIASGLAALQGRCADVRIGSYPVLEDGRWSVRVVVRAFDRARLDEVADAVRSLV